MNDANELFVLEEKFLNKDFRRNRQAIAELLADDFHEFGSSGRVWTKQQILDKLESEPPFEAVMQDFEATKLAGEVVLVTYAVTLQSSDSESRTSLRSSVWIRRDDRWKMIFHQGTPASGN